MPFDARLPRGPFDNEDDRQRWVEEATKRVLADPDFQRMIVLALQAMVEGEQLSIKNSRS